jgi:hypothetical protein
LKTATAFVATILERQAIAKRVASVVLGVAILVLCTLPKSAFGNLFVAVPGSFLGPGYIGEYTNSGATINASLITGLTDITQIAVSDGFIYVANRNGTIGKYTTSGATIDPTLISGLHDPFDVEVSGGDLYVLETSFPNNRVSKYTTSGETVNASLITGVFGYGLAVSGTDLFVENQFGIGHYTTSGATVDASFLTEDFLNEGVIDLEASRSDLFVTYNYGDGAKLAKYNLDGTLIDPALLDSSGGIMAISGTDLFMEFGPTVAKLTTSGEFVTYPLIPFQRQGISGLDDEAMVPETLSTLWFGLTTVGLLAFARFLRNSRPLVQASR